MQRYLLFILTGVTLLWSTSSYAVYDGTLGADSGINPNPHNLSIYSTSGIKANNIQTDPDHGKEKQICVFCHTPHATAATPLWGRPAPTGPFNLFAEPGSVKDSVKNLGINDPGIVDDSHYGDTSSGYEYPNGSSKLCLSCHDGVTAIGILSDNTEIDMVGGSLVGINLAISHPISFIYNATVQSDLNNLGKDDTYKLPAAGSVYLDGFNRVQCTTCHQPHLDTIGNGGDLPFWRINNGVDPTDYDTVCNVCHTTTYTPFNDHGYP